MRNNSYLCHCLAVQDLNIIEARLYLRKQQVENPIIIFINARVGDLMRAREVTLLGDFIGSHNLNLGDPLLRLQEQCFLITCNVHIHRLLSS